MMEAVEDIGHNHLANVISVSDGTGETTYPSGTAEINAQDPGELAAASAGILFLGATGDCGVVQNLAVANSQCEAAGTTPSTAIWDESPWLTAVGGSVPDVSAETGAKLGPDRLWHVAPPDAEFSEGAGFSAVFPHPAYQDGVASITDSNMRSVPDLTMDAQHGTSEAAPMLAGVFALATQENGADIGPINPALYDTLGPVGASDGIADVVSGNNSADKPGGSVLVPGFTAGPGFDVASGWGTLYAPAFVASSPRRRPHTRRPPPGSPPSSSSRASRPNLHDRPAETRLGPGKAHRDTAKPAGRRDRALCLAIVTVSVRSAVSFQHRSQSRRRSKPIRRRRHDQPPGSSPTRSGAPVVIGWV